MRKQDEEKDSGPTDSDSFNFPDRQMEADPGVFESGRPNMLDRTDDTPPVPEDALDRYGDSRPDRRDPGGFDDVAEDPIMTTLRDEEHQPEVRKEDPEFLAGHRVDREDEIVGRPAGDYFEKEIAVLRPKTGAENQEGEER